MLPLRAVLQSVRMPGTAPIRTERFSIAIAGSGKLFGMFATDCFMRFPNVTIYDRSERTMAFRRQEVALGKSQFASRDFRKFALKTQKNLDRPPKTDATLTFQTVSFELENVTIVGRKGRRLLRFRFDEKTTTIEDIENYVQQIIQAMLAVV